MDRAKKVIGYVMESEAPADIIERVRGALSINPSVMAFLDEYLKKK